MKKKMIKYPEVLIFLCISVVLPAQENYDLSSLVRRALLENYNILIVRNEEKIADNNHTLGNAGFLPTIDIQGTISRSSNNTKQEFFSGVIRESDDADSKNLNSYVIMNWKVFDGLMMFARYDQLGLLKEIGALDTKYYIEQTVSDIADAWYELIKEKMLLANYNQTLDVSRFRLSLESKKLDVGSGNLLLYNQALVDFSTDSITVMNQKRLIRSLVIQINQLVNLDPDLEINVLNPEIIPEIILQKDSLISKAVRANQEIKKSMLQEMVSETNIRVRRSAYFPEVNLYGQLSYSEQSNEISTLKYGRTLGKQIGITVRYNLFNGFNDRREVENAKLTHENSSLERENITKQIRSTVLDNFYQYQSLSRQLMLAEQNTLAAQKSLDIAKIQYEKGDISGYDFRQTQLSLIRSQNTALSLRYNLKSTEIELLRLTGDLMERFAVAQ